MRNINVFNMANMSITIPRPCVSFNLASIKQFSTENGYKLLHHSKSFRRWNKSLMVCEKAPSRFFSSKPSASVLSSKNISSKFSQILRALFYLLIISAFTAFMSNKSFVP